MEKCETARKTASKLLVNHGLTTLTLDDLIAIIEDSGFVIVDYSSNRNDSYMNALIKELSVQKLIDEGKAFTYQRDNTKIVFVCERMTAEEKRYVLAHELGHISCGHLETGVSYCQSVNDEYVANEFAHYLLHPGVVVQARAWCHSHRIATVLIIALLIFAIASVSVAHYVSLQRSFYGEYYTTDSGERYHLKGCPIIRGKSNIHRLTKEEFEAGKYKPCMVCMPGAG